MGSRLRCRWSTRCRKKCMPRRQLRRRRPWTLRALADEVGASDERCGRVAHPLDYIVDVRALDAIVRNHAHPAFAVDRGEHTIATQCAREILPVAAHVEDDDVALDR